MAIYAVIAQPGANAEKLPAAIEEAFPEAHLQLSADTWLVAATGTPTEVSDKIGISDGSNGLGVVLEIGGYYGRASNNIWSWIKAKWEATANG